jgi:hypothetical protein
MPLRRLLPLLSCPLCAANTGGRAFPLLRNPFTLLCGHTVCSSHLETLDPTQRCPIPICSSLINQDAARPNIPSSSRVIYHPAAPPPSSFRQATAATDLFDQRVDITISKLIEVVSRHSPPNHGDVNLPHGEDVGVHPEQAPTVANLPSSDEETESHAARVTGRSSGRRRRHRGAPDLASRSTPASASSTSVVSADLAGGSLPSSSGHAGRSCSPSLQTAGGESSDGSDSGPEPPRKRSRRDTRALVTDRVVQSCVIEPEAETGNSDRPQANRPGAEPRQDTDETRTCERESTRNS